MGIIRAAIKWTAIAFAGMIAVAVVFALVMGGGGSGPNGTDAPPTSSQTAAEAQSTQAQTDAATETTTATATSTPTETQTSANEQNTVTVRVSYDGEWSGNVGSTASQRSVDGSGEETFEVDVEESFDAVSAVFQKMDEGDGELVVEIVDGGEVVAEQSTTAEFGTVSVSYSVS